MAMGDFPCRIPSTIRSHRYSAWRRLAPIKDANPATRSGDGCSRTICGGSLPIAHEPNARTPFSIDAGQAFNQDLRCERSRGEHRSTAPAISIIFAQRRIDDG
jgi:hypothetical protein